MVVGHAAASCLLASLANKKPALGGLEKAQVLRRLSDASIAHTTASVSISNSHKTSPHNSTSRRLHHNWD
jgi:hypothetical protein